MQLNNTGLIQGQENKNDYLPGSLRNRGISMCQCRKGSICARLR